MKHFISNQWREGRGDPFCSHNPATQAVVWEGCEANQEDVEEALASARAAFPKWSRLSPSDRATHLKKYERALAQKKKELGEAISMETGKPLWESSQEVEAMIAQIDISIKAHGERCQDRKLADDLFTHHKPLGVVAVCGPLNFPAHLHSGHIVHALLAGNTVVFKSSPLTPLLASLIVRCMEHLPEGVVNLVQGGDSTGHSLASHPQIDGLFFSGSFKAGSDFLETIGRHPEKRLAPEMGGNNPLIFCDALDLEAAAYNTILSAYLTSGQRGSCARRLIIPEGREGDEFLKVLTPMTASIQVGPYTDLPEPFMGPVISPESVDLLLNTQATYGAEGGRCLVEMIRLHDELPFLTPGLMDVTEVDHRVDEELFGPFLQVIRVPSFEAALVEANQTAYGLTAGLFTSSREKYEQFFHIVRASVINWNYPTTGASYREGTSYFSYPVASLKREKIVLPPTIAPGITLLSQS